MSGLNRRIARNSDERRISGHRRKALTTAAIRAALADIPVSLDKEYQDESGPRQIVDP